MNFSQKLCFFMDSRKISAYKMSKDTGISDRLIGYWRKGEKMPGAENLITIANYFGTSIDYLLDRTDNPNLLSSNTYNNISNSTFDNKLAESNSFEFNNQPKQLDDNRELIELINKLSLVERSEVIVTINDMVKKKGA